jgi:hypothetical protein
MKTLRADVNAHHAIEDDPHSGSDCMEVAFAARIPDVLIFDGEKVS